MAVHMAVYMAIGIAVAIDLAVHMVIDMARFRRSGAQQPASCEFDRIFLTVLEKLRPVDPEAMNNGPKMAQDGPKMASRWCQDGRSSSS